jgi:hypothetical protein
MSTAKRSGRTRATADDLHGSAKSTDEVKLQGFPLCEQTED